MFVSYAQNGEDIVLFRALGHIANGVYVDVGAADPTVDSVTRAFSERGWRGLNVEPNPAYAAALRIERPRDVTIEACAGPERATATLHLVVGTGLSSLLDESADLVGAEEYEVRDIVVDVDRLDALIRAAGLSEGEIHFLKIDVEGFEQGVLEGLDLVAIRPWVIVVESTLPRSNVQVHDRWEHLLTDAGYSFCLFDGLNRFYCASEHADLAPVLATPVSVFDQPYMIWPHRQLELMHLQTVADYQALEATHLQTVADYQALEATHLQTVADYQALEATYQRTVADYERADAAYLDAERRAEGLGVEVTAARQSIDAMQQTEASLRAGISDLADQIDAARAERDAARGEVEAMRQTVSWRLTAPVRRVRRLVRR